MSTPVRVVIILLCVVALYFLVVTLARNVAEGALLETPYAPSTAAASPGPGAAGTGR